MYHHVLVPVDVSPESRRAVAEAARFAERHDARLTVLAVVRPVDTGTLDTLGTEGIERTLEAAQRRKGESTIADVLADVEPSGIAFDTEVVPGVAHRAICEYAESAGVDLIVMGASGRESLTEYVLGSTTERVTQWCDVPVLVV